MNITFFLLFLSLFCSFLIEAYEASNDNSVISHHEIQQSPQNESSRGIKFTSLNTDVQHIIFDFLNLTDLTNLVEAYPQMSSMAIGIFRRDYKECDICIERVYPGAGIDGQLRWADSMQTYDLQTLLNIYKHFNCLIPSIEIRNYNIHSNESTLINNFINKYGKNSLKSLAIYPIKEDTFVEFSSPFEGLEDLYFQADIYVEAIKMPVLSFDKLFPNLRGLFLILRPNIDYSFIDCHMPNLQHLYLSIDDRAWDKNGSIEGMIKQNPQIRSLDIQEIPVNYSKTVIDLLSNIENLTLFECDFHEPTHFGSVKNFKVTKIGPKSIEWLSFRNLESLSLEYDSRETAAWVTFFKNHSSLSGLHLTDGLFSNAAIPLAEFTRELPHLVEVSIDSPDFISVDVMNDFISSHGNLQTFLQLFGRFSAEHKAYENDYRERFSNEWIIIHKELPRSFLTFERKRTKH